MSENTTTADVDVGDELWARGRAARELGVDPLTVTRWARAGKLPSRRTPGGHRRYRAADVRALAVRRSR